MAKTFIVARRADREALLGALRRLGVLHVEPVDPSRAAPDADTTEALDRMRRAIQILETTEPEGAAPDLSPVEAADEVLRIQRAGAERINRLATLHRQIERLAPWGDVTVEQLRSLRDVGLEPRFFVLPADRAGEVRAECVDVLGPWQGKRVLVAALQRDGEPEVPEDAEPVPGPSRDRPSLRAEAQQIDAAIKKDADRLRRLANLADAMREEQTRLAARAEWTATARSALEDERLYALQGWVPAEEVDGLAGRIAQEGVEAAVEAVEPDEDEEPPTLIRYPRWAKPIKGLFDILNTFPGYREMDLSPFFMVALPLFAAMLIGDAGYGFVISLLAVVFYGKLAKTAGKPKTQLLLVVGLMTLVWGVLSANYFGITPGSIAEVGGFTRVVDGEAVPDYEAMRAGPGAWATVGQAMLAPAVAWDPDPQTARYLLMKISFVIGAVHLILAHLRKAADYAPDQRFLAELGWCGVLGGMLVLIWHLVFIGVKQTPMRTFNLLFAVIGGAWLLPILFGTPSRNPLKRVGKGLAAALLPLLSTFSDTMSYVRLMAVGLASYYIAMAFNTLAALLADAITWYSVAPVIVLVFGHALNIGLAAIAIFAHGVRLNMLEFSNNAGVQWAGFAYAPFTAAKDHEE
jgi:V/A-type H+-transporting ATPase subunit I